MQKFLANFKADNYKWPFPPKLLPEFLQLENENENLELPSYCCFED